MYLVKLRRVRTEATQKERERIARDSDAQIGLLLSAPRNPGGSAHDTHGQLSTLRRHPLMNFNRVSLTSPFIDVPT